MRRLFFFILSFPLLMTAEPLTKWPSNKKDLYDVNKKPVLWNIGKNGALVFFISEHCPFDLDWQARIADLAKWAAQNDFSVVAVNPFSAKQFVKNSNKALIQRARELGDKVHLVSDHQRELTNLLRVDKTPFAVLYNSAKNRVYYGAIDDQPNADLKPSQHFLKSAMLQTLAGEKVSMPFSPALGCKITKEKL